MPCRVTKKRNSGNLSCKQNNVHIITLSLPGVTKKNTFYVRVTIHNKKEDDKKERNTIKDIV